MNGLRQERGIDFADIRSLDQDNPGVLPQFPGHLAVSHVNGIDLLRAVLQQAVGESPG